ncbi:MAG: hypothetical protein RLZZ28_1868 [Bacteroidota bacterium]|jgi:hypothetical protein
MKKNSVTKILSLLLMSTTFFAFTHPANKQANFSGSWVLNESKSELGQFGARGASSKIEVDQKSESVTINRTGVSFSTGETIVSGVTLPNDGKEVESMFLGSSKMKSSLKWAADGNSFAISYSIAFEMNGQTFDITGNEKWSLGADGKSIVLLTTLSTPQGEIETKALYDKQ